MLGLNIGIDLGTANVIVYQQGKGIVMSEPSIVAYKTGTGKVLAVGKKAYQMLGKEPDSIEVVRPMRDGVVSNFTVAEHMLRYFIKKICGNEIFKPNIIICMPGTVTNLERRTILDVITASGAGKACLLEEPIAAALGAGIKTLNPHGVMIVDLGGGTTDVAVITMSSMAVASSLKVAGNKLTDDIIRYCSWERNVLIGEQTAEEIKKTVGCAYQRSNELAMIAKGKDYITGMPMEFEITSNEAYFAMRPHILSILDSIVDVLEQTPPELSADIMEEGIVLTGGTALLYGMKEVVQERTGIKTRVADDPLNCVANGIGLCLADLNLLANNGYLFMSRQDISGVANTEEGDY